MDKIILNDQQKEAVEHQAGPLLIIAGAGTGKTTVITERIKYLILKELAHPQEILGLTFTEKAAREMEERVDQAVPYGYTQMWVSTFHSFCDRILRNEAVQIGLSTGFRLIGEAEATQLIQDNLWNLNLSYFRPRGNPTKFVVALLTHFNRLKDEDISPKQYLAWVKNQKLDKTDKEGLAKWTELAFAYKQYENLKIKQGMVDFADLISNVLQLFRQRANVLKQYQKQFKFILVDEFQDTNIAQYELVKLLAPDGIRPNLTMTGDDSQSIYKFRGAAVSNILSFMKDYKHAKHVVLTKNYRSTQTILNHAYQLIKHNDPDTLEAKLGIDKNLTALRSKAKQHPLQLLYQERVEDEAESVAQTIQQLKKEQDNLRWADFAVLVRANNHAEPFVQALRRRGIPFQFLGPGQLFRQEEVRDLIAYLKTLAHFDDSAAFYRVLAMDIWDISGRDLAVLNTVAKRSHLSLFEVCEEIVNQAEKKNDERKLTDEQLPRLAKKTVHSLQQIVKMLHRHLELVPKDTAGQILYYFLEDSKLLPRLVALPESVKQEKQISNISRFFDKLKTYETEREDASVFAVTDWLELSLELGESPLASNLDWTQEDRVNILTAHSAKGLEFPVVFLVNLVNLRFPSVNRREPIPIPEELIQESLPEGDFHEQEERRLFYVGMTRACDRLFFTASRYYGESKRERKLSGFVQEALGKDALRTQLSAQETDQLELFDAWKKTVPADEEEKQKHTVSFLSYSRINTFQICPLHYRLRYILKIPTPSTPALTLGESVHEALKHYYRYLLEKERWSKSSLTRSKDKLLQFLKQSWASTGFSNRKEERESFKTAQEYLAAFHDQEASKGFYTKVAEELFNFPLTQNLKIGGRIDRIDLHPDGKLEIIDYKTSQKVSSQMKVDKDLQLTIYALAATEVRHPLLLKQPNQILLSLYFFEEQKKITTTRTAQQLIKAKEKIINIALQIEESGFRCSCSTWCTKCEYQLYCNTSPVD